MNHSLQDIHLTAETLAVIAESETRRNHLFGSPSSTAAVNNSMTGARPSNFLVQAPSSVGTLGLPSDRLNYILSNLGGNPSYELFHNNAVRMNASLHHQHHHRNHNNNSNHNHNNNRNHGESTFAENIPFGLWDFLQSNNNHNHPTLGPPRLTVDQEAQLLNFHTAADLETDSLWRLRPDDRADNDDDLSVYSQLFDSTTLSSRSRRRLQPGITTTTSSMDTDIAVNGFSELHNENQEGAVAENEAKPPASIMVNQRPSTRPGSGASPNLPLRHTRSMTAANRRQHHNHNISNNNTARAVATTTASSSPVAAIYNNTACQINRRSTLSTDTRSRRNTISSRKRNQQDRSSPPHACKKLKIDAGKSGVKSEESSDATSTATNKKGNKKKDEMDASKKCCICLEIPTFTELAKIDACDHPYCFGCIEEWAKRENTCPQCKARFAIIKRVNKVKATKKKRKGGHIGDSCSNNIKKVKDRDQRSDYRQHSNLQSFLASIEAQGLGMLFQPDDAMPQALQQVLNTNVEVARRAAESNIHDNMSVTFPFTNNLGVSRQPHISSILLNHGALSSPSHLQNQPNVGHVNGTAHYDPSQYITLRSARLLRRGLTRQLPIHSRPDSFLYRNRVDLDMLDMDININLGDNVAPRHSPPPLHARRNDVALFNEALASASSESVHDFDVMDGQNLYMPSVSRVEPRSFAVNAHDHRAGLSADNALEILDDSDDGGENEVGERQR